MKPSLVCLIVLLSTVAVSAQLTDPIEGVATMGWNAGPTGPIPLSAALGEPTGPTDAFLLPQNLRAENLPASRAGTAPTALDEVNAPRLLHDPAPIFGGSGTGIPPDAATLGVDNIKAFYNEPPAWLSVPEPATYLRVLGICGLLALALFGLVALTYLPRSFRPAGG